jgi:hypothetical protein
MSGQAPLADGRVQNRIENYNAFWKDDLSKEEEQDNKSRLDKYTEVVNGTWQYHMDPSPFPNYFLFILQAITTALPTSTSTAGPSPSTSPASTRERPSSHRLLVMSTILHRR